MNMDEHWRVSATVKKLPFVDVISVPIILLSASFNYNTFQGICGIEN